MSAPSPVADRPAPLSGTEPETTAPQRYARWAQQVRHRPLHAITAAVTLVLCALLLYPLVIMIWRTFVLDGDVIGFDEFERVFTDPRTRSAIVNTAIILFTAGPLALVVGGMLAWLNERTDARFGIVGELLPIASLLVPPIAGSIAWTFLLSPNSGFANVLIRDGLSVLGIQLEDGPFDVFSWYGVILAYTAYMVPYAYLPLAASLRSLDPALEEAARMAGSSPLRTFVTVTLPAVKPAALSAVFLVTVVGLGIYSVPSILGTRSGIDVVSTRIVQAMKFSYPPDTRTALLLGLAMLVVIGVVWILQSRSARSSNFARISSRGQSDAVVTLGRWRPVARIGMLGYLLMMSVVPLSAILFVSLQRYWTPDVKWDELGLHNYRALLASSGPAGEALRNSLWLGVVGSVIGVLAAVFAALYLHRSTAWQARVADGVLKLPGNMSHIVLAVAFVLAFAGDPFRLGNTRWLLLIAFIAVYLYQAVLQSSDALSRVGNDLMDASYTSGHGEGRTLRWVTLPLMAPGLVSAGILFFVHIIGDVNAAAILAGSRNPVVGSTLVDLYEGGDHAQLAALAGILSLISVLFVLTALSLARFLGRRR
ncbi:ABC transporter permease [Rhodococcus rhodochrous]|uniref:Iron ABC transporter permease n=1 Tax=Rhodococcus rhodochrous TaxID=1829 RepID=A0AAW4XJY2_RHORH|nr:iron ABC transporter permease [Rhodococcus rhodochrous]MCD2113491.1 iron ABC transporter permease [Rhodococcus rhodochrous]